MNQRNKSAGYPFSLFAGEGLGISHSSLNSLDSFLPTRACGQAEIKCGVNITNGNAVIQDHLLSFPDIGCTIAFSYLYNSADTSTPWRFAWARQVKCREENTSVTIVEADGHELIYSYHAGDNCYYAQTYQEGMPSIRYNRQTGEYTWYHPASHITEIFNEIGNITERIDQSGNSTCYEYNAFNQLEAIVAPSGARYEIKREHDRIEIYLNKDRPILLHSYVIDETGYLLKSITSDQYEITYTYAEKNCLLESIVQTDSSIIKLDYYSDAFNKNKIQTIQVGNDETNTITLSYSESKTIIQDPSWVESTLIFNERSQPLSFSYDSKTRSEQDINHYQFNEANQLEAITYSDDSAEIFEYDGKTKLLKCQIHRDGSSTKFYYSNDATPLLIAKADYDKDDNHPVSCLRYVYDKKFNDSYTILRYEISANGRVKEYISNAYGLIEQTRIYLHDAYACSDNIREVPTLSDMETWKENLKQKGNLSNTTLTNYSYNAEGQIAHIVAFAKVNDQGEGIEDASINETTLAYDERGHMTQKSISLGSDTYAKTEYTFDALGRKTNEIVGSDLTLQQASTYEYTNNTITVTLLNHRIETQTLNSQGVVEDESVTVEGSHVVRQSYYHYFPANRAEIITLPNRDKVLKLYDTQQRLCTMISAGGSVSTFEYHNKTRTQIKTEYACLFDMTAFYLEQDDNLSILLELVYQYLETEKNNTQNRYSYTFVGLNDLPQYEVDAAGYLTEYRYHIKGKPTHTIKYQDPMTADELNILTHGNTLDRTPNRKHDRVESNYYDADGNLIASQDVAGYATVFMRDVGGRVCEEIHYHKPNLIVTDDFIDPTPIPDKDAHVYYFYDSANQCILEVDVEGYITSYTYYPDGKKQTEKRYATRVNADWYDNTAIIPQVTLHTNDEEIQYDYDELRRLTVLRKSSGATITFTYDNMNKQTATYSRDVAHMDSSSGDHCRGQASRFDAWGQEIAQANAFVVQQLCRTDVIGLDEIEKQREKDAIWESKSTRYYYDSVGLKVKSIDSNGHTTLYYYDKEQRLILTIDASGAVIENKYNSFGELIETHKYYQCLKEDILTTLIGGYVNDEIWALLNVSEKDIVTTYKRDQRGLIYEEIDAENHITRFEFNAFKQCTHEYLPVDDNNICLHIEHQYEARGFETKTIKDDSQIIVTTEKKYDHYLGKQTENIDEIGAHTVFIRDRLGNIQKTQKSVAKDAYLTIGEVRYDAFSRPVEQIDADQHSILITYNNKEKTHIAMHAGDNSQTIMRENIFGEIIETTECAADETWIRYQASVTHAPDGQVEQRINGLGASVITRYDVLGQKQSVTNEMGMTLTFERNKANQLSCVTVDANEHRLQLKTRFEPNAFGQNEVIIDARDITTTQVFDRLGRVKQSIRDVGDGKLNRVTTYTHNTQGNQTSIRQGDNQNKHLEIQVFDSFNRLKATVIDPEGLQIYTAFQCDAAGNIVKETDAESHVKRTYYDLFQRKRFEITEHNESEFSAIEYEYTDSGNLRSLRSYAIPITQDQITDTTTLVELNAIFKKSHQDTVTCYYQDNNGRDRFKVKLLYVPKTNNYQGFVEETHYDAADREIKKVCYATPIEIDINTSHNTATIADLVSAIASPTKDRTVYRWYDKASQERLTVDQDGVAVQKQYDRAGRMIVETHYFYPLDNPDVHIAYDVDYVINRLNIDKTRDRTKYHVYDGIGRLIFEVAPNRSVTRNDYDANNNQVQVCQFKEVVPAYESYEALITYLYTLEPNPNKDSITKTIFDHADNIIAIVDALSSENQLNTDSFTRNALGNVDVHTDRAGHQWRYEYDGANRLTVEISPETTISHITLEPASYNIFSNVVDNREKIKKKTFFDKVSNPIMIIDGEGLDDARTFHASYNAKKQLVGTKLTDVTIDNPDASPYFFYTIYSGLTMSTLKLASLTTSIIYNTKGKKIAEQDETGVWSHYVYDSAERLIYEVQKGCALIAYSYNAFDEVVQEYRYAAPFTIDLTPYREKGIFDDTIIQWFEVTAQDRVTNYTYDNVGQLIHSKSATVLYYADSKVGSAQPETNKRYNVFGECIYEAKLISPDVWAEKFTYVDDNGLVAVEVDENKYVIQYQRDSAGRIVERIEYANPLPLRIALTPSLTVDELASHIRKDINQDRIYRYTYDQLGQKISEIQVNVITQRIELDEHHVPSMVDNAPAMVETKWGYTPTQQLSYTEYAAGQREYIYYNECDLKIGETKLTCMSVHEVGQLLVTPFTRFKLNAFGQTVVTQQSSKGCKVAQANILPEFVDPASLCEEMVDFDNRGLVRLKRDAENRISIFTYTRTRKVARQIQELFYNPLRSVLDIKNMTYDVFDRPIQLTFLRDHDVEDCTYTQYNIFGDFIGEGQNGIDWPLRRKVDMCGNTFFAHAENGAGTLSLYDLRGMETLRIQSAQKDLNVVDYDDIPGLFTVDLTEIECTETLRDAGGRVIAQRFPIWFSQQPPLPSRQYQLDHWGNITQQKDSLGYVTDFTYNHQNHLIEQQQPMVDVVDEHGVSERKRPITKYGYNARGQQVGMTDANQHTSANELDELGHTVTHILPDGTLKERNIFNALGQMIITLDARNQPWHFEYNKVNQPILAKFPSGRWIKRDYDKKGGLASVIDASNFHIDYEYDVRGNTARRTLPSGGWTAGHTLISGAWTVMTYDHNALPLQMSNSDQDMSTMRWDRDYFGNPNHHIDLGGHSYVYVYDYKKQLIQQTRTGSSWPTAELSSSFTMSKEPDYPMPIYSSQIIRPAPSADIRYDYSYGQLSMVTDKGICKRTVYTNDSEGRRREVATYDNLPSSSRLLYTWCSDLDELGREQRATAVHLTAFGQMATLTSLLNYDGVGNHRSIRMRLIPAGYSASCPGATQYQEHWYLYDVADRIIVHSGVLTEGKIHILPGRGLAFDYETDLRAREHTLNAQGTPIDVSLRYDPDAMLQETEVVGKITTTYGYHASGWACALKEHALTSSGQWHNVERNITFNQNNQLATDSSVGASTTTYYYRDSGYPESIVSAGSSTETRQIRYVGLDALVQRQVHAFCTGDHGKILWVADAEYGLDANGNVNGKKNSEDEPDTTSGSIYLITTYDGLIVNKLFVPNAVLYGTTTSNKEYCFFHNANGELLAGYSATYSIAEAQGHANFHLAHQGTDVRPTTSNLVIRSAIHPVGRTTPMDPQAKNDPLNWDEAAYLQLGSQYYTTEPGDSLEKIAVKVYGDIDAAELLARFNGLPSTYYSVQAGHVLRLPMYIGSSNKTGVISPYQQFKSIVLGSLVPHAIIPRPKKHHAHLFGSLVKVLALAIVVTVAPSLAPALLGIVSPAVTALGLGSALSGATAFAIATSVISALGDAAVQGVAIGLGIQAKFSLTETLEVGVNAGFGTLAKIEDFTSITEIATKAFTVGASVVTTQLIEMQAGIRGKFDAKAVAFQASASITASYLGHGAKTVLGKSTSLTDAAIRGTAIMSANALLGHAVIGTPIHIQYLAANALGTIIGNTIGDKIGKPPLSEPEKAENEVTSTKPTASKKSVNMLSDHELAETEMALSKLPAPKLNLSGIGYQHDPYAVDLSEMSRRARPQRMRLQSTKAESSNLADVLRDVGKTVAGQVVERGGKILETMESEYRVMSYTVRGIEDSALKLSIKAHVLGVSAGFDLIQADGDPSKAVKGFIHDFTFDLVLGGAALPFTALQLYDKLVYTPRTQAQIDDEYNRNVAAVLGTQRTRGQLMRSAMAAETLRQCEIMANAYHTVVSAPDQLFEAGWQHMEQHFTTHIPMSLASESLEMSTSVLRAAPELNDAIQQSNRALTSGILSPRQSKSASSQTQTWANLFQPTRSTVTEPNHTLDSLLQRK